MSRCYSPIEIPNKERADSFLTVPCGQCIGCRLNRAEGWAARMMHEASLHEHNSFITLTYDDHHLPSHGSLTPDHITLFFKKLRKKLAGKKILYYYCGEYGENLSRPHYHLALFGYDFSPDRTPHRETQSGTVYRSPSLEKLWDKGFSEIGNLEYDSARYVAGYIQKKVNGTKAQSHYQQITQQGEIIDLHPEFARMSRRPAIGLNWINKYSSDIYNYDLCVVGDKKLRPPAYYDKWLKKTDEKKFIQIKSNREDSCIGTTMNPSDLTKTYEAKVIASKQIHRSLEGVPAHTPDGERLDYYKRLQTENHFYQKAKK
ncbi:MAG: replication initiator protein [Wigfec virus K19_141]|nr:MAG: replication initiator protein [Wigfec virus K19_141]